VIVAMVPKVYFHSGSTKVASVAPTNMASGRANRRVGQGKKRKRLRIRGNVTMASKHKVSRSGKHQRRITVACLWYYVVTARNLSFCLDATVGTPGPTAALAQTLTGTMSGGGGQEKERKRLMDNASVTKASKKRKA
jgi:hypothetical protein